MKVRIEIDKDTLVKLIIKEIQTVLDLPTMSKDLVKIEVKSKQNYRSEWEQADFRAIYAGEK